MILQEQVYDEVVPEVAGGDGLVAKTLFDYEAGWALSIVLLSILS